MNKILIKTYFHKNIFNPDLATIRLEAECTCLDTNVITSSDYRINYFNETNKVWTWDISKKSINISKSLCSIDAINYIILMNGICQTK